MSACWTWPGAIDPKTGYGRRSVGGKLWLAHRYAWTVTRGPIPDGLVIDHLCRNRACVNVEHLEVVTQAENIARGNSPTAIAARTNTCKRGHSLTGDNVRVYSGRRNCLTCKAMHNASRRRAAA